MGRSLSLTILPSVLAVCPLGPREPVPSWVDKSPFYSLTRTADELSIVCSQESVPSGIRCERDWRSLKVEGPLDFALVGILADLAAALARAGVSIFVVSTFDTDYVLVKQHDLNRAVTSLSDEGYVIRQTPA